MPLVAPIATAKLVLSEKDIPESIVRLKLVVSMTDTT